MILIQVPPDKIEQVLPLVNHLLGRAIQHSRGTETLQGVAEQIKSQNAQLWLVIDEDDNNKAVAAGVSVIHSYVSGLKNAHIKLLGGENMKSWFGLKDEFENWAKEEGCTNVTLYARKGWAKHLPDYDITHYLMAKELH